MTMSSNKISVQDRKDLEKFIKFLVLKSSQIIVQSRLGEKIKTECNPHTSSNDWFNLTIYDHPDVQAETKKALQLSSHESVLPRLPLCVEISLQTVEGDKMILEVWSINVIAEQCNPTSRTTHATYNRMGILLKSLLSVTRVTPAYKLSRRQSLDSYNIYYRIYVGEPQIHNLGDGHKQVRVGQVCTQIGTINMAVAYRTKMTISPTQTGRDTIMLKSDHFLKDLSPKHIRYNYNKKNEKKVIDLDKPMRCGAFVDASRIKQYTEEDFLLPETPPFSWLLRKTKDELSNQYSDNNSTDDEKTSSILITSPGADENTSVVLNNNNNNININNNLNNNNTNVKIMDSKLSQSPNCGTSPNSKSASRWSLRGIQPEDEKLLKELHFPFATANTPISDLAKFYRECFNAPQLQHFSTDLSTDSTSTLLDGDENIQSVDDLTKQLEQFETSLPDYDGMIQSLVDNQSVDSNSNS